MCGTVQYPPPPTRRLNNSMSFVSVSDDDGNVQNGNVLNGNVQNGNVQNGTFHNPQDDTDSTIDNMGEVCECTGGRTRVVREWYINNVNQNPPTSTTSCVQCRRTICGRCDITCIVCRVRCCEDCCSAEDADGRLLEPCFLACPTPSCQILACQDCFTPCSFCEVTAWCPEFIDMANTSKHIDV